VAKHLSLKRKWVDLLSRDYKGFDNAETVYLDVAKISRKTAVKPTDSIIDTRRLRVLA